MNKDIKWLQGTWVVVHYETAGKADEDAPANEFLVTFRADRFDIRLGESVIYKGTFKLDPAKSPKTIDMSLTEAHGEAAEGWVWHGIYKIGSLSIKWCMAEVDGKERPTDFVTKEGDGCHLFVLKGQEKGTS
jgi:uncharacterized protein (TIGR03067 family)